MWKFIKYSFNKAFEKNLLNLIIFFIALSFIGVLIISTVIFVFQKIGLLSESNFFVETLWQGFNLFFDQNAIFGLDGSKNNFFDFFGNCFCNFANVASRDVNDPSLLVLLLLQILIIIKYDFNNYVFNSLLSLKYLFSSTSF